MSAEVPRLFVFARHAESTANTTHALSSDPARPVALTERGRAQARALGEQLANVHIDLAVGTRFQRTQETIGIALQGRRVPVLIEPGFDELRADDLDGAPWRPAGSANPIGGPDRAAGRGGPVEPGDRCSAVPHRARSDTTWARCLPRW